MEKFLLPKTGQTPSVLIDKVQELIELEGRSIPEDSLKFYTPIFEWVDGFSINKESKTTVNIKLEYFDTSSFKCLWDLFERFNTMKNNGKSLDINWYYENDDIEMLETGKDFKDNTGLTINFIGVDQLF